LQLPLKDLSALCSKTPIKNRLDELFPLVNFLDPRSFPDINEFVGRWHEPDWSFDHKGVDIYSAQYLHAKVFAFDKVAFVGSANASLNSSRHRRGLSRSRLRGAGKRTLRDVRVVPEAVTARARHTAPIRPRILSRRRHNDGEPQSRCRAATTCREARSSHPVAMTVAKAVRVRSGLSDPR
jgi:hypothetical protein